MAWVQRWRGRERQAVAVLRDMSTGMTARQERICSYSLGACLASGLPASPLQGGHACLPASFTQHPESSLTLRRLPAQELRGGGQLLLWGGEGSWAPAMHMAVWMQMSFALPASEWKDPTPLGLYPSHGAGAPGR